MTKAEKRKLKQELDDLKKQISAMQLRVNNAQGETAKSYLKLKLDQLTEKRNTLLSQKLGIEKLN